jgi:homoserine kinase
VRVRVPATSANLGPGFDTFGLALSMYDELRVRVDDAPVARVEVTGVGAGEVDTGEDNLVVRSIRRTFTELGVHAAGLHVEAHNVIPHGRGLGSSGAAIVSGILAAKGLAAGLAAMNAHEVFVLATALEGHPDNVAPAIYGGLTIAWLSHEGPRAKKLMVHRGVSPLVLVPDRVMSTSLARSLQPAQVPHEDAVFNLSRSALLVAALTQSPELLLEATEDRLHQDYRAAAMPQTHELVTLLRARGFAAVVSGSGPSVLVLCDDPAKRLAASELAMSHGAGHWEARLPAVDFKGATVRQEADPLSSAVTAQDSIPQPG